MADKSSEMTFWDHLDALRGVLFRIGIVICVLTIGFFCVMPELFNAVILAPCRPDFPLYKLFDGIDGDGLLMPALSGDGFSITLVNIRLASQFLIHVSCSVWAAFIIGFPLIIYIIWTFVSPALYEREKRAARKAFALGCSMFYLGILTAYFMVFPMTLRFLADYRLSDTITNTVSIDSYMDTFFTLVLAMGLVFELPLLAWTLGKAGILTKTFFRKYRRHAIVALLITAAVITPTGDPVTLFAVFIPLYALWELGGLLVPEKPVDNQGDGPVAGDIAGSSETIH